MGMGKAREAEWEVSGERLGIEGGDGFDFVGVEFEGVDAEADFTRIGGAGGGDELDGAGDGLGVTLKAQSDRSAEDDSPAVLEGAFCFIKLLFPAQVSGFAGVRIEAEFTLVEGHGVRERD